MHSDVYGTVPAASETDTKMNKANEKQDEAAFVTVYGALNNGKQWQGCIRCQLPVLLQLIHGKRSKVCMLFGYTEKLF